MERLRLRRRSRSRWSALRPISDRMRHLRLGLLAIGILSLVAEAVGAAAVFWRRQHETS